MGTGFSLDSYWVWYPHTMIFFKSFFGHYHTSKTLYLHVILGGFIFDLETAKW